MNFTERLQAILDWIASHSARLSRSGVQAPNHLAGARVYFCQEDSADPQACYVDEKLTVEQTHPIIMTARGQLAGHLNQVWLKPDSKYRVEVHDSDGEVLFTEDHIQT